MAYFRYKIKNIEPLRISDDSTSQSGQTVSLRYIPGSAVRGLAVNHLATTMGDDFENVKKALFSNQIRFLNAYIYGNNHELIPSPKGFYEDKTTSTKKKIENVVVDGKFTEGMKRAGLGRYCYIEDGCVYYYSVNTGSDMKIRINDVKKSEVFRNEYIAAGNTFVGYIAIDDSASVEMIESIFTDEILIGNARSQGFGKCKVEEKGVIPDSEIPYSVYGVSGDVEGGCYMMLLSNTVMRNALGEYAGIDTETLASQMGVSDLSIEHCATSTVNVKGYNSKWGSKIPSANMYEMGSVFKLNFKGTFTAEKIAEISNSGIGIRKNEGFGRVIFLKEYDSIAYKQEGVKNTPVQENAVKLSEDDNTLKIIASVYYRRMLNEAMQEHILDKVDSINLPKSQEGKVMSILSQNRYDAVKGTEVVKKYFAHAMEKQENRKVHQAKAGIDSFMNRIISILDNALEDTLDVHVGGTVMGIATDSLIAPDELQRMKFDYIIDLIKYGNKGDK